MSIRRRLWSLATECQSADGYGVNVQLKPWQNNINAKPTFVLECQEEYRHRVHVVGPRCSGVLQCPSEFSVRIACSVSDSRSPRIPWAHGKVRENRKLGGIFPFWGQTYEIDDSRSYICQTPSRRKVEERGEKKIKKRTQIVKAHP